MMRFLGNLLLPIFGEIYMAFRLFLILSLTLYVTGCGYGFRGSESALPPDVTKVYVSKAQNNTAQAGVDRLVTEALRDEFERYGTLTVVESRSEADAELRSKIVTIKRETRTVTSGTDTALQLATVMTVAADLRRTTGPLLWKNENMEVMKIFGAESGVVVTSSPEFASGNLGSSDLANLDSVEVTRGQEKQALEDLSEILAQRVYAAAVLPEF